MSIRSSVVTSFRASFKKFHSLYSSLAFHSSNCSCCFAGSIFRLAGIFITVFASAWGLGLDLDLMGFGLVGVLDGD